MVARNESVGVNYLKIVPKNLLSRAVGQVMKARHPVLLAKAARDIFANYYKINLDEAEKPLAEYRNIAELFTRRLKPGIRPIGEGPVHPCDGVLTTAESVDSEMLLQAKGIQYSLDLLVNENGAEKNYRGGVALTYYLCPTDYHRVHSPVDADIVKIAHVPGTLWPVNEKSVVTVPQLFAINERLIFHMMTPRGRVLLIMVGATNVGRMTVSFDASITTNSSSRRNAHNFEYPRADFSHAVHIKKGDELGIFHMGSTVIVLYPPEFLANIPHKGPVRIGQSI